MQHRNGYDSYIEMSRIMMRRNTPARNWCLSWNFRHRLLCTAHQPTWYTYKMPMENAWTVAIAKKNAMVKISTIYMMRLQTVLLFNVVRNGHFIQEKEKVWKAVAEDDDRTTWTTDALKTFKSTHIHETHKPSVQFLSQTSSFRNPNRQNTTSHKLKFHP